MKDLAGIFRNRIELRQIGVRDEAKMIGGIGICGRPYCCSQFLDDFQPVSTKMAKVQSLSLNPTKISGSCGRLMCCLRYEQEAYEDLIKKVPKQGAFVEKVPKQGAFVETIDGYGTAAQVNLLRQTVKVKLDQDKDDTLHVYKAGELAAVPGGRPREGEEPPHVLNYVPPEPEESPEQEDPWVLPVLPEPQPQEQPAPEQPEEPKKSRRRRSGRGRSKNENPAPAAEESQTKAAGEKKQAKPARKKENAPAAEQKPREENKRGSGRRHNHIKAVKAENKNPGENAPKEQKPPKAEKAAGTESEKVREGHARGRRRRPRGKGKPGGENKAE